MTNLANTYHKQGRLNEAEQLGIQVMDMRKKLLGAEHPKTLNSMENLAITYMHQGRWNELEQLEVQVLYHFIQLDSVVMRDRLDKILVSSFSSFSHDVPKLCQNCGWHQVLSI